MLRGFVLLFLALSCNTQLHECTAWHALVASLEHCRSVSSPDGVSESGLSMVLGLAALPLLLPLTTRMSGIGIASSGTAGDQL